MGPTANAGTPTKRTPTTRAPSSWTFRAAPGIQRNAVSDFGVGVPMRQEIQFKDGKLIWLHGVILAGAPDLFLRDLGDPAKGVRIDLRKLIPEAEQELPGTSTRDVAGYVSFALRGLYPRLQDFLDAAVNNGGVS